MRPLCALPALLLLASSAHAQFQCNTEVRFHFISVRKDDGSGGPWFTPSQMSIFVNKANEVFGPAGLTFGYRQTQDWEELNSTLLWHGLRAYNGSEPDQLQAAVLAQRIADARPGKIVVFFREDVIGHYAAPRLLGAKPPGTTWQDGLDYISHANFATNPGLDLNTRADTFAHEVGHYLGLYHSHPAAADLSTEDAKGRLETTEMPFTSCSSDAQCPVPGTRCVSFFCRHTMDGDPNVPDNTEDPSPTPWLNDCAPMPQCPPGLAKVGPNCECASYASIGSKTIATDLFCFTAADCGSTGVGQTHACVNNRCTFTYTPDRTNVMSYYGEGATTTPGQRARIQATINAIPQRNLLCNVPCWPNFHNLPVSSADTCLNYWKYRDGLGPHALSVDWSGTSVAGTLRSGNNGWAKTASRDDYENASVFWPWFGSASSHYSWRPNVPVALGISKNLAGATNTQTFHRLDWNAFVTQWNQQYNAGRALIDVSVTRSNPLELSAVWANQGGFTSATYWLGTEADVKSFSNSFYVNGIRLDRVVPIANGGGHTLLANWNRSTALRGIWSVSNAQYPSLFGLLGGLGYRVHDLEYFENGGLVSVWEAPHNECTAGGRLHSDTDACTKLICDTHTPWADSYCCNNAWDSVCVSEVTSWCGRACPP